MDRKKTALSSNRRVYLLETHVTFRPIVKYTWHTASREPKLARPSQPNSASLRFIHAKFGNICDYHASNKYGLCSVGDLSAHEEYHPEAAFLEGIGSQKSGKFCLLLSP